MQVLTELEVYHAGELSVIGFGGREHLDPLNLAECYDEIMSLIREHQCQTLAIDLTGVRGIPSGLLGVLASVHRLHVEVHLYNPSRDVREVLEITKLDRIFHSHDIEI